MEIEIVGLHKESMKKVVTGVECSRSCSTKAGGDNIGVLLRGVSAGHRARDGSGEDGIDQAPHEVHGEVYILSKEEAGVTRRSSRVPPAFYFRTTT